MKRLLLIITLLISSKSNAQVTWNNYAKRISKDEYELHLTAKIQKPWHIYSTNMEKGGPIPTSISINTKEIECLGEWKEIGHLIKMHEAVFDIDVKYFEDQVDFVRVIKVSSLKVPPIEGVIEFMLCSGSRCMPPKNVPFSASLK